jgi:hypothetical protein
MSIRRTDCHRDSRVGHSVSPGSLARHHHHLAMLLPVHRAQDAEKDPSLPHDGKAVVYQHGHRSQRTTKPIPWFNAILVLRMCLKGESSPADCTHAQ